MSKSRRCLQRHSIIDSRSYLDFLFFVFSEEHALNRLRLCLIIIKISVGDSGCSENATCELTDGLREKCRIVEHDVTTQMEKASASPSSGPSFGREPSKPSHSRDAEVQSKWHEKRSKIFRNIRSPKRFSMCGNFNLSVYLR